MAITRAQTESILISRAGKRMNLVDMDIVTSDGTNEDLVDPISTALLSMGVTPADITDPSDEDLLSVDVVEFLDRAELRLLENISGNIDLTDITVGPRSQSLGQLASQLERLIKQKYDKIVSSYGADATLQAGSFSMNFQQKNSDRQTSD